MEVTMLESTGRRGSHLMLRTRQRGASGFVRAAVNIGFQSFENGQIRSGQARSAETLCQQNQMRLLAIRV